MKPVIKVNAEDVIRNFKNTLTMAGDARSLLTIIKGKNNDNRPWTIKGSILRAFINKKDPGDSGDSWKDLSLNYIKRKQVKFAGKPTLVASGNLFNSLVNSNGSTVSIMTKKKLIYGTSLDYARYHMTGTKSMPARRFMGINKEQRKTIKLLVGKYYSDIMNGKKPEGPK